MLGLRSSGFGLVVATFGSGFGTGTGAGAGGGLRATSGTGVGLVTGFGAIGFSLSSLPCSSAMVRSTSFLSEASGTLTRYILKYCSACEECPAILWLWAML